jgi:hypothetical protein
MSEAALAKVEQPGAIARASELEVSEVAARVAKIRAIAQSVMQEGKHFGNIPGVDKPTLLKPGAELLCLTFQLAPKFKEKERRTGDHLEVVTTCTLIAANGREIGSATGSCSTRESKYAYRKGGRKCPSCGKVGSLLKSKNEPEWFCWRKKDGCGATFGLDVPEIANQNPDRIPNPDLPDTWNTVRKMASKRALVAAVLIVTCASDLYTQDVEEGHADADGSDPEPKEAAKPAGKPQPVADEKTIGELLARLETAENVAELDAISKGAKGFHFSREQRQRLTEAYRARQVELAPDAQAFGGAS